MTCSPPLERPKIAIIPVIEWEYDYPEKSILQDQKKLQEFNFKEITLCLPIKVNVEKGLVLQDSVLIQSFIRAAQSYLQIYGSYTLCFRFEGDTEVWLAQQQDLLPFFSSYQRWITKIITLLPKPPERIILGNDIYSVHQEIAWEFLIKQLRKNQIQGKFLIASLPERIYANIPWQLCDEIGILFNSPEDGNYKKYARNHHPKIAALSDQLKKPIYIVRPNLLETHATIPFKNLLRFWPDSTKISGIQISTIFPTPVFSDTNQPYGRAKDVEFLQTIRSYTAQ
ncbi:MAG: hypothetical protein LC115_02440 [Bacteroidia bacterium]|nr:hypothetical protein [Bacteroidia bacterium]